MSALRKAGRQTVVDCGLFCEVSHTGCDEYATHTFREGGMTVDACDACDPQIPYEL